MAGVFALRFPAGRGRDEEVERFRGERLERFAVEVAAGVDVHLVDQQLVPARGRRDLQRRDEREIRDRAVAGDEEKQVAARAHLPGDSFEIVAGAVHEIKPGAPSGSA